MGTVRHSLLHPSTRPRWTLAKPSTLDLAVLGFLQHHDVLPSSYVRAHFPSEASTQKALSRLGGGHYIQIPDGYEHTNAAYRVRPVQLSKRGVQLLQQHGLYRPRDHMGDQFKHAYLREVINYSFNHAPQELTKLTFEGDGAFEVNGTRVVPDAPIFGYQLGDKKIYFHGFEADRGTEQRSKRKVGSSQYGKKTIEDNIEAYAEYHRQGLHRNWGIARIYILFITTSDPNNIIDLIKDCVPEESIQKRFLVKGLPDFLAYDPLPPATGHMVTAPWLTTHGPFNIYKALKGGE